MPKTAPGLPLIYSGRPDLLDWICVFIFPIAGALKLLEENMWRSTGSQYLLWIWLRYISLAMPELVCGVLIVIFPHKAYARYVRFRSFIMGQLSRLGIDSGGEGYLDRTDYILRLILTFLLGAGLILFGAMFLFATIRDMCARPECILGPCNF
jgi:hypothetical protein